MNHMEQSSTHRRFHAQIILSFYPAHRWLNFQLEPCPHKIYIQQAARDKMKIGVAPAKTTKKKRNMIRRRSVKCDQPKDLHVQFGKIPLFICKGHFVEVSGIFITSNQKKKKGIFITSTSFGK